MFSFRVRFTLATHSRLQLSQQAPKLTQQAPQPSMDPSDIPPASSDAVPSTPLDIPHVTINDTPVKLTSTTTLPFTTHVKYHIKMYNNLGHEMQGHLLGPMPIDNFLSTFFLHSKCVKVVNPYAETVCSVNKTLAYKPFVSTTSDLYPVN